jgi:aspartyl/asparaginyl-tRNA synthetase
VNRNQRAEHNFTLHNSILTGAYVEMEGVLVKSPASEQEYELKVSSIRVPGPSDAQVTGISFKQASFGLTWLC